jgi:hypothetical protein
MHKERSSSGDYAIIQAALCPACTLNALLHNQDPDPDDGDWDEAS